MATKDGQTPDDDQAGSVNLSGRNPRPQTVPTAGRFGQTDNDGTRAKTGEPPHQDWTERVRYEP